MREYRKVALLGTYLAASMEEMTVALKVAMRVAERAEKKVAKREDSMAA